MDEPKDAGGHCAAWAQDDEGRERICEEADAVHGDSEEPGQPPKRTSVPWLSVCNCRQD